MNEHGDIRGDDPSDANPTSPSGTDAAMTPWAPDPSAAPEQPAVPDGGHFDDTAEPAATPVFSGGVAAAARPRGRRVLALGLAATVLLTIGAGGGALAAIQLQNGQQTTSAQVGGGSNGGSAAGGGANAQPGTPGSGFAPGSGNGFGNGNGHGFGPGFSDGSTGSGTSTRSGTAATTAQTVGVVTIVTTLGYESGEAAGTGIILNSSGRILTNNHVIDGATAIRVTVESTGTSYPAKVVGTDATDDVAVLQLAGASGLTPASLATSSAAVGDSITAVGNAGGTGTLSAATGSVTALDQSITTAAEGSSSSERLTGLIETDANVVAGDSGGPLVNAAGTVLGIDTAASAGSADVTGYAIPIGHAISVAADIVAGKDTADITLGYPAFLGVSVSPRASATGGGAVLGQVIPGTPAASTGLAAGDTITAVDGTSIGSASELTSTLRGHRPGDSVKITYTDANGAGHSVRVTLTTGPAD